MCRRVDIRVSESEIAFDNTKLLAMGRKFRKCLKIAREIGDRRVDKVLEAIFFREMKAYMDDSKTYNVMIEEVHARIEERHEIILELRKLAGGTVLEECLLDLKVAEEEDFAEIGRLMQMSYAAAIKVGEKSRMIKKVRKT